MSTNTKNSRRLWAIVRNAALVVVIALVATYLLAGGLLRSLELTAGDLLFRLRGEIEQESPVVLVAIDESSFSQNNLQWPWPRDYMARIVDGINEGGPRVIAIDVAYPEPSDPEADAELARALSETENAILIAQISTESREGITLRQVVRPIPELDAVTTMGLTNFPLDEDGTVRRLLAFQSFNDELFYSWAMHAARMYLDADTFNPVSREEAYIGEDHYVQMDDLHLRVNFRGEPAQTVPYVSAYQVADGLVNPEIFNGKIVIIGATAELLQDQYPTPFLGNPPRSMPGAEINAHAMDTIINQRYITRIEGFPVLLIALVAAVIGLLVNLRLRPEMGLIIVIVLLGIYSFGAYMLFVGLRVIMPIVAPLSSLGFAFVVNTAIQLYEEQRERARVRNLFDRYVSPAAIDEMLEHGDELELRGERRELSILFSDIRGFTSLSEQLTPDEVVDILNEYLEEMTRIIFEYEGTIDKFLGDAILAIWNAPLEVEDYSSKAVECAIAMSKRLSELQERWAATGHVVLKTGTGITTGPVFVGNIGSSQRMDYTVIGDTVNLASRLEAFTKDLGVQILFNERTMELLREEMKARFVTEEHIKGKEEPVKIYTVDPGSHGLSLDEGVDLDAIPEELVQTRK